MHFVVEYDHKQCLNSKENASYNNLAKVTVFSSLVCENVCHKLDEHEACQSRVEFFQVEQVLQILFELVLNRVRHFLHKR
jgi:hypothetical protein